MPQGITTTQVKDAPSSSQREGRLVEETQRGTSNEISEKLGEASGWQQAASMLLQAAGPSGRSALLAERERFEAVIRRLRSQRRAWE